MMSLRYFKSVRLDDGNHDVIPTRCLRNANVTACMGMAWVPSQFLLMCAWLKSLLLLPPFSCPVFHALIFSSTPISIFIFGS